MRYFPVVDELHSQVYMLALSGYGAKDIAGRLGLDQRAVEQILKEVAREQVGPSSADRITNSEGRRAIPDSFATPDGLVVRLLTVAADQAIETWAGLTLQAETSGTWPIILADDTSLPGYDPLLRIIEDGARASGAPLAALLAAADVVDPEQLLEGLWRDSLPLEEDPDEQAFEAFSETVPTDPVTPIPAPLLPTSGRATIALVPCSSDDQIPAVLGWGGWNACPPSQDHVALLRRWRHRYGAHLQAMSPDALELVVSDPPTTFDAAVVLAKEQFAYASDIVYQGEHPTIGALAAALVGSQRWYFWWD
jgi:hypothetical protein